MLPKKIIYPLASIINLTNGGVIPRDNSNHNNNVNPDEYVNLFLGADEGGHVFPGACHPFGMVKMGVDVVDAPEGDAYSGYALGGRIFGISMMHESGTGGAPEYGVVAQMPTVGDIPLGRDISQPRKPSNSIDHASIGYYRTNLNNDIGIEFAATPHAGIYHYHFPSNTTSTNSKRDNNASNSSQTIFQSNQPSVIVNVTHHLSAPSRPRWTQKFVNGSINLGEDSKSYRGSGTFRGGWAYQKPWTIYFCGRFDQKAESVVGFQATKLMNDKLQLQSTADDKQQISDLGAIFSFPDGTADVKSKVGISFISEDQACQNVDKEIKDHFQVGKVAKEAKKEWGQQVFNKIEADTSNHSIATMLYSSFYASHLLPSDRTGENPKWDTSYNKNPYYDDWFTQWDIFRSLMPLFNVFNPGKATEMMSSLVSIYKNEGFMPDGRSANQNGKTQGGSNSDIVLADAYIKGIGKNSDILDWNEGYRAVVKDAEVQPPNNNDPMAPDSSTKEGRGAIPDWHKYGYVTRNYTRSVTRTMEYAYDDYGVAVIAKGLGKEDDYYKYLNRSGNWRNIWNHNATAKGYNYTGFIQPRNADGTFNDTDYDPLSCGGCYWGDDEYEGSPIEYGFSVPHDTETLIEYMGGNETFVQRLDDMFGLYGGDPLADIGNEPSFLTPFLYNFVNAQYKTVETTRFLVNSHFGPGNKGLPGNSDAGAMQSWLIWNLIGIYPITGTTTYLLSSPFTSYFKMKLASGNLVITAENLDANKNSVYVQEVWVNDKKWDKNWVSHQDIFSSNGGSIHFVLGSEISQWETGDVPPSPGHL